MKTNCGKGSVITVAYINLYNQRGKIVTRKTKMIIAVIVLIALSCCFGTIGGLHYERFCKADGGSGGYMAEDIGDPRIHMAYDEFDYYGHEQCHYFTRGEGGFWGCEDCGYPVKDQAYLDKFSNENDIIHISSHRLPDDFKG